MAINVGYDDLLTESADDANISAKTGTITSNIVTAKAVHGGLFHVWGTSADSIALQGTTDPNFAAGSWETLLTKTEALPQSIDFTGLSWPFYRLVITNGSSVTARYFILEA